MSERKLDRCFNCDSKITEFNIENDILDVFLECTTRQFSFLILRVVEKMRFDEIARRFGVTQERTRQFINKSFDSIVRKCSLRGIKINEDDIIRVILDNIQRIPYLKKIEVYKLDEDILNSLHSRNYAEKIDVEKYELYKNKKTIDMSTPIEDVFKIEGSMRTYLCLKSIGIETISQLINKTFEDLLFIKNFGRKSINEVVTILNSHGLSLASDKIKEGSPCLKD